MKHVPMIVSCLIAALHGQSGPIIDLFGGLEKERAEAFNKWQATRDSFDKTYFSDRSGSLSYCDPRFPDSLKDLKEVFGLNHRKQLEYYQRWLGDTNDSIKSKQVTIARLDEHYQRVQTTYRMKDQEVKALSNKQLEIDQLIKEDPERGKAVKETWQRTFDKSKQGLESFKETKFNRNAARINVEARLADLAQIKTGIIQSIELIEAEKELQLSYYDLRESEADLRCNKNLRPAEPLIRNPKKR